MLRLNVSAKLQAQESVSSSAAWSAWSRVAVTSACVRAIIRVESMQAINSRSRHTNRIGAGSVYDNQQQQTAYASGWSQYQTGCWTTLGCCGLHSLVDCWRSCLEPQAWLLACLTCCRHSSPALRKWHAALCQPCTAINGEIFHLQRDVCKVPVASL